MNNSKRLLDNKKGIIEVAKYSFNIQLFLLPLLGYIFYYFYNQLDHTHIFAYPNFDFYELKQWVIMFICEDVIFYHVHRILHHPKLYYLHKLHHTWKHPIPWETLYSSIPENILINFFPVLTAPLIVQLNIYYLFVWVAIATLIGVITHSNYSMPHTIHHTHFTVNYGATRFFDILYGTYKAPHSLP